MPDLAIEQLLLARRTMWDVLKTSLYGKRIIANAIVYTIGTMVPQVINLLLMPVLTRYVSPFEFGIFTYTNSIAVFLGIIGSLSINNYVLRHYFDCSTDDDRRNLFGSLFAFLAIWNIVLFSVELVGIPFVLEKLHTQVPVYPYFAIALLNTGIEVLAAIPLAYFRVREAAHKFVALTAAQVILSVIATLYFVVLRHQGILGRYYGQLLANAVMLIVYVCIIIRIGKLSLNPALIRASLAFSLPLVPATIFFAITAVSDRLILERFVPLGQLGLYGVGFSIAYALNGLVNGVNRAIEPTIYRAAGAAALDRRILQIKRSVLMAFAALGCVLIASSREIVEILLGPKYFASYKIIGLVVMAPVLQGITVPLAVYAMAIRATRYFPRIYLAGALASVGCNLLLVPYFGIIGAAISSIVSSLVVLLLFGFHINLVHQIDWRLYEDLLVLGGAFASGQLILQIWMPSIMISLAIKTCVLTLPLAVLLHLGSKGQLGKRRLAIL